MRRSARTPLLLALGTLLLLGGGGSCFSFGDAKPTKGCAKDVSGPSLFGDASWGNWGSGECGLFGPSIACCFNIHRDVTKLAKHIVDRCGCGPELACAEQCILGDASVCTLYDPPLGLDYPPCASCIGEQPLDAQCASEAMADCADDADCKALADCMRGVEWPLVDAGAAGGSSSQGGMSGHGGTSGQGGAGGSGAANVGGAPTDAGTD
jgi:hypothetical protein